MAHPIPKENSELVRLIVELRRAARSHQAPIWASVADRLERPRHQVTPVNVGHLNRLTEAGETVHEAFMRAIAGNPRFRPARPSGGRAFIIGGAKAAAQKRDDGQA